MHVRFFFAVCLCWLSAFSFSMAQSQKPSINISEHDIFYWWDEGVITPEQANEMLILLEEDNQSELCILAQVYAQETCQEEDIVAESRDAVFMPHGFVQWKGALDSTGLLKNHREEMQILFYRFKLRLGSQNLLSYRDGRYMAYLGQVSTRELQSQIPLDTLWGAIVSFPVGKFQLGGILDTLGTSGFGSSLLFDKKSSVGFFAWSTESIMLQGHFPFGNVSGWWQYPQADPLLRFDLRGKHPIGRTRLTWKTSAYVHGDSVPEQAHLSSTVLSSRLWGAQTIMVNFPDLADGRLTVSARIINPLHSDSVSTRFKGELVSGPKYLRGGFTLTCLEGSDNCRQTDWKVFEDSEIFTYWLMGGSAKMRHSRGTGFERPRLEASIGFKACPKNFVKLIFIAPDGNPSSKFLLKNEAQLTGDFLSFVLSTTFRSTKNTSLHPYHGSLTARVFF